MFLRASALIMQQVLGVGTDIKVLGWIHRCWNGYLGDGMISMCWNIYLGVGMDI